MKKAKTNKKIVSILSAVLGVVFAFITGVTYSVSTLDLNYGNNPKSTTAYLANQQYHIVNDTLENPIPFGEGSHNFEIALQYAFDYNFDVRLRYEVRWSDGALATNAILHFANRDDIIYDENYIFIADGISAGNGKRTIITGVDFVSTSSDSSYVGKSLKINITDVLIYKQTDSYDLTESVLTKNILSSVAAQAWIYHKNKSTSTDAYAMMYNYRRNFDNGVPYPGLETAYKKPLNISTTYVSGSAWAGGNRSYAGIGMYVITGKSEVKLDVEVAGIWRVKTIDENGTSISDANQSLISENSIKFNYTNEWVHSSWDDSSLWETRKFTYTIPANSSQFINILDNVEITSAGKISTILYDEYRAVTNKISVNPSLGTMGSNPTSFATMFEYTEGNAPLVQIKPISSNSAITTTANYSSKNKDITVVNSSLYSNGLYTAQIGSSASEQSFNTNFSLINNTATTKTVNVAYQLYYHINNAQRDLVGALTQGGTEVRADEYVRMQTWTKEEAFENDDINYTYETTSTRLTSTTLPTTVTIAPYSSVNLAEIYKVGAALQSDIQTKFDPIDAETQTQLDGIAEYHDAWTYVVVTPTVTTTASGSALVVETVQNGNTVTLSVKNNSTKTITGITVDNVIVKELKTSTEYVELESQPKDWTASYWKYYSYTAQTGYVKLTSDPVTADNTFDKGSYWELPADFEEITVTPSSNFEKSGNKFTSKSSLGSLQPGETAVFATATTSSTNQIVVSGNAKTTTMAEATTLTVINNGKSSAYLINNTDKSSAPKSYYVKFTGTYIGENLLNINDAELNFELSEVNFVTDGTSVYYLGIVRPGQIISLPLSSNATITSIQATGNYSASTLSSWNTNVVALMTNLFNTQK